MCGIETAFFAFRYSEGRVRAPPRVKDSGPRFVLFESDARGWMFT